MRTGLVVALSFLLIGCDAGNESSEVHQVDSSSPIETSVEDSSTVLDTAPMETAATDKDGDGLDDAYEAKIAADYLPFLSLDPSDGCPRSVSVFRVYPHPDAKGTRLHVIVDTLFEKDCGASGHVGDNEVFGMTIDPSKPAPEGILAVRAISHQNTTCEAITNCGSCGGYDKCTTGTRNGKPYPVVFYSKNKHGAYMSEGKCDNACFFTNFCVLAPAPTEPRLVNAGEPAKPLVNDLTAAGYITAANGWTEMTVFNYDVWGGKDFGKAGKVNEDLIDPAFLTPACP